MTNTDIATLLRKVASAYRILDENRFRIIAYEKAADSIDHLTQDVKDYWSNKALTDIPGVGGGIAANLDELFRTGSSSHWDHVFSQIPAATFPLLLVPGIGPKKAYQLVRSLDLDNEESVVSDLETAAKAGRIAPLEGFGEKSQQVILESIAAYKRGQIKENRISLEEADRLAGEVIHHLEKTGAVIRSDVLGSLRRRVSTIGDIDIAVSTKKPDVVLDAFVSFPNQRVVDRGERGSTILLVNGRQVDLRVQDPSSYGAMLQYFTGSKQHNIALREHALSKGLSLSEHGIKSTKTKKLTTYETEEAFYQATGLPWIPPELREDAGEIDAAKKNALPSLVSVSDIRGEFHVHSSYDLHSSHDVGRNSIGEMFTKAENRGYEYLGFSDHNPAITGVSKNEIVAIMERRKKDYEHQYSSWVKNVSKSKKPPKLILMCEVDILANGELALPDEAFPYVDAVIVSLHSSFSQPKDVVTKRICSALLAHPKVKIFGHPTGRLIGSREGVHANWQEVFSVAASRGIALEINSAPTRLDLPDTLVRDAASLGVSFVVDTDAHAADHMDLLPYGVSVARRGWLAARDIRNTLGYNECIEWITSP